MSDFITVAELRIEAERLCDENEYLLAENAKLRRLLHLIFNQDYNDEFVELMCDLRIEETTNDREHDKER